MSQNANYYQFVRRNLEYTKICTKKCKILENTSDDSLDQKGSNCLANCAWYLINFKEFNDDALRRSVPHRTIYVNAGVSKDVANDESKEVAPEVDYTEVNTE